ncbi:hypothetical protein [Mycoplasma suis]|uniref:Uncharacterized protein n=2 Tax=Mycoplasma suis TaxID=57372 RepID=F0QQ75_MYCSL|nr:hypothetical protein [Mycoplasma suis]ADX97645.1 hypothetical protein MSU_0101 [Mycoplasma suis str. Illinois]CBZ40181.1 hypothetical protein MSUIS_00880 [Mycoplasma suis KI3806]
MFTASAWVKIVLAAVSFGGAAGGTYLIKNSSDNYSENHSASSPNQRDNEMSLKMNPEEGIKNDEKGLNPQKELQGVPKDSSLNSENILQEPLVDSFVSQDLSEQTEQVDVITREERETVSSRKIIAETINYWEKEGGKKELTCDRWYEFGSNNQETLESNECESLFNSVWKNREEKPEKILVVKGEKLVNVLVRLDESLMTKETTDISKELKTGLRINGGEMSCLEKGNIDEGRILINCSSVTRTLET